MYKLLVAITKSSFGASLGFKGGTLAYFMYNLPRFSVDLDFDIIKDIPGDELMKGLEKILSKYAVIKDMYEKRFTYFFLMDYGINQQKVKIEINKRVVYRSEYELKTLFGVAMYTMKTSAIITNKCIALLERNRTASRDLFDIYHFLKQGRNLDEELIKNRTGYSVLQYLEKCKKFILSHFNEKNLLAGLGELVDDKQKYWIKHQLVNETIGLIDLYLLDI